MKNNIIIILLVICLFGIGYVIYYQQLYIPKKISKCQDIAIRFEKLRHPSSNDLTVTNEDILLFMKNMSSCFTD